MMRNMEDGHHNENRVRDHAAPCRTLRQFRSWVLRFGFRGVAVNVALKTRIRLNRSAGTSGGAACAVIRVLCDSSRRIVNGRVDTCARRRGWLLDPMAEHLHTFVRTRKLELS